MGPGRRRINHRTAREARLRGVLPSAPVQPLVNATIRKIHYVLNGAYKRGIRWRWVATNPMNQAEPPAYRALTRSPRGRRKQPACSKGRGETGLGCAGLARHDHRRPRGDQLLLAADVFDATAGDVVHVTRNRGWPALSAAPGRLRRVARDRARPALS